MVGEETSGECASVAHGERAVGVDILLVRQAQALAPVAECERANVFGVVVQAHDRADATDVADARVTVDEKCIEGIEHRLERGGSGGDEAVVVVGVCDETVYRVEESERRALLGCDLAQLGLQRLEIGVLQFVELWRHVEHGYRTARERPVAKFRSRAHDSAACVRLHLEGGVTVEQTGDSALRDAGLLGDVFASDHGSPSSA